MDLGFAGFSLHAQSDFQAGRKSVREMIRRRPCSLDDIAEGLFLLALAAYVLSARTINMHRSAVMAFCNWCVAEGRLTARRAEQCIPRAFGESFVI